MVTTRSLMLAAAVGASLLAGCGNAQVTAGSDSEMSIPAGGGVKLVPSVPYGETPPRPTGALGAAWAAADAYNRQHTTVTGWPFVEGDRLVITAASDEALAKAKADAPAAGFHYERVDYRLVARSAEQLGQIFEDITRLKESDVPGAGTIITAQGDPAGNRVIIRTRKAPKPMLAALERRYGPDAVAVMITRDMPQPGY